MPDALYLHDGEQQIAVRFRTEEDRERFKAHYRRLDALGVRWRDALQIILDLATNELLDTAQACKEIERHAASALSGEETG